MGGDGNSWMGIKLLRLISCHIIIIIHNYTSSHITLASERNGELNRKTTEERRHKCPYSFDFPPFLVYMRMLLSFKLCLG